MNRRIWITDARKSCTNDRVGQIEDKKKSIGAFKSVCSLFKIYNDLH